MLSPSVPAEEAQRLHALDALGLLDSPGEARFDRLTRLACQWFDAPIALVVFLDEERQWFKSSQGITIRQTPREHAICAHTILGDGALIVPDTLEDPRFCDNPLVTGEPHVRFYAGHPLTAAGGERVGTLCVIDTRPRAFSERGERLLSDLAALVEAQLRARLVRVPQVQLYSELDRGARRSAVDPLTQLWNEAPALEILRRELDRSQRVGEGLAVVVVDARGVAALERTLGCRGGDLALKEVGQRLRGALRSVDAAARIGQHEFMGILTGIGPPQAHRIAGRLSQAIGDLPILVGDTSVALPVSVGMALASDSCVGEALVAQARGALWRISGPIN